MTCAGIAYLSITSGQVGDGDARFEGEVLRCCGEQLDNREILKGLTWLDRNFTLNGNPNWTFWRSYYYYSLERAGQLTSRRCVGGRDWYREGCGENSAQYRALRITELKAIP